MMTYLTLTWSGIQHWQYEAKEELFKKIDDSLDAVAVAEEIIEGKEVEMNDFITSLSSTHRSWNWPRI